MLFYRPLLTLLTLMPLSWSIISSAQTPLATQHFKLLSYNVFMPIGLAGAFAAKNQRLPHLPGQLKNFDIIALSEMTDDRIRKESYSHLQEIFPHQVTPPGNGRGFMHRHSGLWLLSRFPIIKTEKLVYGPRAGMDTLVDKGAIFARIQLPGNRQIEVVLTHLQAFQKNKHQKIREGQLRELWDFIKIHHYVNVPMVITGDFNIVAAHQQHYQSMLQLLDNPQDLFLLYGESESPGYTYDTLENSFAFGQYRSRLDYILYHPVQNANSLQPQEVQVEKFPLNAGPNGPPFLSDHFGVSAIFQLF